MSADSLRGEAGDKRGQKREGHALLAATINLLT
jgi:hypothetical protein